MGIDEGIMNASYLRCMFAQTTRQGLPAREVQQFSLKFPLIVVTDCKCAYDHLHNLSGGPSKDRRTALDVAIIREELQRNQATIRWIDGKKLQITDSLTKKNGNADLLRSIIKRGQYVITDEDLALKLKENERNERNRRRGRGVAVLRVSNVFRVWEE